MSSGQKAAYEDAVEREYRDDIEKIKQLTPEQIYLAIVGFNQNWYYANVANIPLTEAQRQRLNSARQSIAQLGITRLSCF